MLDDTTWHQLTMRKGETLKTFTFSDTEYPEIHIRKLINGTTTGLPGAVFEVKINGKMLDSTLPLIRTGL